MIPLNLFLKDATAAGDTDAIERATIEYGNAIKDLVAANIFPGDMLWKNFGMTRQGKVVFYDYDEIEYLTDCNFRHVPPPEEGKAQTPDKVWFDVGPKDVFPKTFGPFLLGNARVRQTFMKHHADLLNPDYWNLHKQRIQAGAMLDVFPYEPQRRFVNQRRGGRAGACDGEPLTDLRGSTALGLEAVGGGAKSASAPRSSSTIQRGYRVGRPSGLVMLGELLLYRRRGA